MNIKADPTIIKSTKIYFKGPAPYRYTLRHLPKEFPSFPYAAHRENMACVNGVWEPVERYWASLRTTQAEAEKEYLKKVESEGLMG